MEPRLVLRGWGEELLRRDNVDKRKRKKEAYPPEGTSLQEFAHRFNYSCEEIPAGSTCSCCLRRLLFATQRDDLCYHLHVVYPGRYSCGSVPVSLYLWREGLYSEAKRRDMDRLTAATFDALWS